MRRERLHHIVKTSESPPPLFRTGVDPSPPSRVVQRFHVLKLGPVQVKENPETAHDDTFNNINNKVLSPQIRGVSPSFALLFKCLCD